MTVKDVPRTTDVDSVTIPIRLPLPRLATHRFSAPTAADVRAALHTGCPAEATALWDEIATAAGVPVGAHLLTLEELETLAAAVAARPGVVGLQGRSLAIRVASYRALSDLEGGALPADWARRSIESLLRSRLPDPARSAAIDELDLFRPETRRRLDAAASRAAGRLGTAVGLVTVILDGAQAFAGSHGLSGWMLQSGGTPVEWALCATTVRTREPLVIPDSAADVLHRTNPLVEKDGLASYAGVPLITSGGHVVGGLCVVDGAAHTFTEADVAELRTLADALVAEIEHTSGTGRRPAVPGPARAPLA
jgi:GAF domain-containing protein